MQQKTKEGVTHSNGCRDRLWKWLLGRLGVRGNAAAKGFTDMPNEGVTRMLGKEGGDERRGELSGGRVGVEELGGSQPRDCPL